MTAAPVGDLDNWRQVFVEDFTTDVPLGSFPAAVASKWSAYLDGWADSTGHGRYTPSKTVSVANGLCNVHVHTENGVHMVAAISPKFASTYGRYAVRWRCDPMRNYKFVGLLWPNTPPGSPNKTGEIDGPEMNCDAARVGHFIHRKWPTGATKAPAQGYKFVPADPSEWHESVIEWSPNLIVFFLDGVEVYRDDQNIPSAGFHWMLQVETAMGGAPAPADDVQGNVQFDWVVGYKYDTSAIAPPSLRQLRLVAPATAEGIIPLSVVASSDITSVKWMMDGVEVASDSAAPWTRPFDSTRWSNGPHTLSVKGKGAFWFPGPSQLMTMRNPWDVAYPEVAKGLVNLSLTDQYTWIKQVKWVIDDIEVGSDTVAPFATRWDSTKLPNGAHSIYAKLSAKDQTGWVNSAKHTFTVQN